MALAVAVGLALLVAFTGFVLGLAERAIRREAEARVASTADLSARLVSEQSLRFQEVVSAYAERLEGIGIPRDTRLSDRDGRLVRHTLDDLESRVDGVDSAVFTDISGRVVAVAPAGRVPLGTDLSSRDWFRAVSSGRTPYVSTAYRGAGAGNPKVTAVAVLVRNRSGDPLGMVVAADRGRTQRFADAYGKQVGADVVVTDQAGTVVASTDHADEHLISRATDPLVRLALDGGSGVRVRTLDGRQLVSGYAPVPAAGWTVTADVPASQAFADVPRLRTTLLLGAAVVAFVLVCVIPLLAGRLGRARDALVISEAFQRDLLPSSLPEGVRSHYVASEKRMLLGGDFLDAVRTPDGGLAVCIGDVCGHGPHAAALGATLRAAWRTLALAGRPVDRLELLDRLVEGERPDGDLFATMACAVVPPTGDRVRYALAGHPPPLLVSDGRAVPLEAARGPALGLGARAPFPTGEHPLGDAWTLALYTDGLIEARTKDGGPRIGLEGLMEIVGELTHEGALDGDGLVARVAAIASRRSGGLDDDLALLLVDHRAIRLAAETTAAVDDGRGDAPADTASGLARPHS
jgi:hypothetical protein